MIFRKNSTVHSNVCEVFLAPKRAITSDQAESKGSDLAFSPRAVTESSFCSFTGERKLKLFLHLLSPSLWQSQTEPKAPGLVSQRACSFLIVLVSIVSLIVYAKTLF